MNIQAPNLEKLAHSILEAFGCDAAEASIVSNHLVEANLFGHDSHGVGMLPMYAAQVKDGNLIPNQSPILEAPVGAVTRVDAQRGFGHRMALLALDHAMQTLPEHKVAILALRNSGHISRTGRYAEYCAEHGLVSLHFVNVIGHSPLVAPFGGKEPAFSTNPISMAMPIDGKAKPLLDMATSTVAFNKVRVANNKGESIPPEWVIDAEGKPTTDPTPMAENRIGALTSFGEHKGSGLAIFAELLAGALTSLSTVADADVMPNGALNSMFSVILDPAAFGDPATIANRTSQFCDFVSSKSPTANTDRVLLPGEPEKISNEKRTRDGIPVDETTFEQLLLTGENFGLNRSALEKLANAK